MNYVVWNFNWTVPFETVDYLKITHRKPRKNNCINMHCVLNPLRLIILGCILNIKPWFENQITFAHQKLSYLFSSVVDWSHLTCSKGWARLLEKGWSVGRIQARKCSNQFWRLYYRHSFWVWRWIIAFVLHYLI